MNLGYKPEGTSGLVDSRDVLDQLEAHQVLLNTMIHQAVDHRDHTREMQARIDQLTKKRIRDKFVHWHITSAFMHRMIEFGFEGLHPLVLRLYID